MNCVWYEAPCFKLFNDLLFHLPWPGRLYDTVQEVIDPYLMVQKLRGEKEDK